MMSVRMALLCAGLVVAGCSGGSDTTPSPQPPPPVASPPPPPPPVSSSPTPVERIGPLAVEGSKLVGADGTIVSLTGPSFFWTNTDFNQFRFYNAENVAFFAEEWNATVVRAAVGAQFDGSILEDPEGNMERAITLIDAAIEAGIYVIVDWHSHQAEQNEAEAIAFFTEIAGLYGTTPNLIYEIYNEPGEGVDWSADVRPYAQRVIDAIRAIDPDNLILVGTEAFSQRVDLALADPVIGETNIAYTFHFYAASHMETLRAPVRTAIEQGLPVFISEWGPVEFTGDGLIDRFSTEEWLTFMRENDLSHLVWSVSDTFDSNSLLIRNAPTEGPYSDADLTEAGELAREIISEWTTDNAGRTPAEVAGGG